MVTRTKVTQTETGDHAQGDLTPRPPGDHNVWPAGLTERTAEGDPSFNRTRAGRRPKSPTPGVPEPLDGEPVDPADYDPRAAAVGTPIAFPDPDEPYPTEGTPYPPPTEPPVAQGVIAAKALNDDGTRKDDDGQYPSGKVSGKSDADVASREANLGGGPTRQYDT